MQIILLIMLWKKINKSVLEWLNILLKMKIQARFLLSIPLPIIGPVEGKRVEGYPAFALEISNK